MIFPGFPVFPVQEIDHFSCFPAGNSNTRKCATLIDNEWYEFWNNLTYISYDRKTYSWCATVKILRLFTGSQPRKVGSARGKNSHAPIGREKRELSTPRAEIGGKLSSQRALYFIWFLKSHLGMFP